MANILTGIIDRNRKAIATGQTVKMCYFSEGVEHEIEGVVRVKGYKYRQRQFCVETQNGIRYPFSLMEKPNKQIVMIKDFQYAKDRTKI